ncbi:MAG: hypothetical protein KDB03_24240 [Planctomycetales bacterium]|nr:hypothetical protein [Planctomycetales bacterium]
MLRNTSLTRSLIFVFCLAVAFPSYVSAEPPSFFRTMFRKKQTVSDDQLVLRPEHGPWMILAVTLSGPEAESQAVALAHEIRGTLDLPSFVMHKTMDPNSNLARHSNVRTELDGTTRRYEVKLANGEAESVFAVLVGEYTSDEDPRIEKTLDTIRYSHPRSLGETESATTTKSSSNWVVQKYREVVWSENRDENRKKGKMGAAFLTRNPLLPDDFFETPKVDDFVKELNDQDWIEHSLLDCPGRYTVRVASFTGRVQMATSTNNGGDSSISNALDAAAQQAHKLTVALRKKGEEAYEFHDRFGSYVTIGSFDNLGQEYRGGEFQYNPAMLAILKQWCGYRIVEARDPTTGAISRGQSLNSLDRIPFDAEGKPIPVPRPETSKIYGRNLLGGR